MTTTSWNRNKMRLFLIRHAECQQNVGQAAATDESNSGLTETGKTQVQHLARYFRDNLVQFSHIFSSDLDRATDTAQAICKYQLGAGAARLAPIQTHLLREQQIASPGSLEGTRWKSGAPASSTGSPDGLAGGEPGYTEEESLGQMKARASSFLRDFVVPLLDGPPSRGNNKEEVVAVIAHGMILQVLWICLADFFNPGDIHFGPGVSQADFADQVAPIWSNTGVMELDIKPGRGGVANTATAAGVITASNTAATTASPSVLTGSIPRAMGTGTGPPFAGWSMTILAVDSTTHLSTTQIGRTGGTVRNTVHGSRQGPMDELYGITGAA